MVLHLFLIRNNDAILKVELWVKTSLISAKVVQELKDKLRRARGGLDESNYTKWGHEEIADWIVGLDHKYKQYEDALRVQLKAEDVKGHQFVHLDKGDFHRFGIIIMADKIEIMEHVKRLTSQKTIK